MHIFLYICLLIDIWKNTFFLSINSSAFTIFATYSQRGGCHKNYADEDAVSILHNWPAVQIFISEI